MVYEDHNLETMNYYGGYSQWRLKESKKSLLNSYL